MISTKRTGLKQRYTKYCPYLNSCGHRVTHHFFLQICGTGVYSKCQNYGKMADKLKTPVEWLQKLAIDMADRDKRRALKDITRLL